MDKALLLYKNLSKNHLYHGWIIAAILSLSLLTFREWASPEAELSLFSLVRFLSVLVVVKESRDKGGHDGAKGFILAIFYICCQSTHVLSLKAVICREVMLGKSKRIFADLYLSQLTTHGSSWLLPCNSKSAQSYGQDRHPAPFVKEMSFLLSSFSCKSLDQMIFWGPFKPGLFYISIPLNFSYRASFPKFCC